MKLPGAFFSPWDIFMEKRGCCKADPTPGPRSLSGVFAATHGISILCREKLKQGLLRVAIHRP
jgi:hypothetical protein